MTTTPESIALGQRIREARLAAGLSQVAVATSLWQDPRRQPDISDYEAGLVVPGALMLGKIARALGVNVSELIE